MPKHEALSRIRRHQRADKNRFILAQSVVAVFRAIFRVQEFLVSPEKRQRLQQLRQRMQAIEKDKKVVEVQIKQGKIREGLDALDALRERYSLPEEQAQSERHRSSLKAIWQESDALQAIHTASDGNKSVAVQGYREYLVLHPDSVMAHQYLGGALHILGDRENSLRKYRESLRLAGSDAVHGASARLKIGQILYEQGQTDAALAEVQGIIDEATPKTQSLVCMAFFQLGNMFCETGQRQKARTAWKQAVQWDATKIIAKKAREMLHANP